VTAQEALAKGLEELILVYKFWFRNGTYIKKRVHITEDNVEKFTPIEKFTDIFEKAFQENPDGYVGIEQFIVRVSDVIAFNVEIEEVEK
jgi:hypothetical protein